tara:strand:- start:151 stop:360 length:210 start_codon:yes stop_codon:yes gene_type:complete
MVNQLLGLKVDIAIRARTAQNDNSYTDNQMQVMHEVDVIYEDGQKGIIKIKATDPMDAIEKINQNHGIR